LAFGLSKPEFERGAALKSGGRDWYKDPDMGKIFGVFIFKLRMRIVL
jgi:hypothetical protein